MNDSLVKTLNVLALGRSEELEEWLGVLDGRVQLTRALTLAEAPQALREHSYDLVVGDANLLRFLIGLKRPAQVQESAGGLTSYTWVLDPQGRFLGRFPSEDALPPQVEEPLMQAALDTLKSLKSSSPSSAPAAHRLDFTTDTGDIYQAVLTPLRSGDGVLAGLSVSVTDVTRERRLQNRINVIDDAGRQLVRLDAEQLTKRNAAERLALLEEKVMHYAHELMHFDHVAVFVVDRKTNKLELALASGMPSAVRGIDLYANTEGNGICGYVAATGRSYLCPDVSKDAHYIRGLGNAQSSLTVPLTLGDQLVGVFNIESDRGCAFTEEDRQFAEIFGRSIAMALHTLELLATERHTMTGQLRQDVKAEVLGPLNDALTEVETIREEFIGLDDLRRRLDGLSETIVGIREAFSRVTSPASCVVGSKESRGPRFDPVLQDKRVLIADDEAILRETVRDVLASYGCRVTAVADGPSALAEIARQGAFDLVLSDIRLPGKNGYEIFAAARVADARTPVILMTGFGYDPNHAIVRANREGLNAVLFKPFKVDQLLTEIRSALQSAARAT
ncbi:MAG: response regulator [Phycisphaerae bacterium]|nr:MAG: response regulator [Planctomycetota bacterium]KAB2940142.1 MAG: response regulator [Phycisphaerae bacterium]MBE7455758.1 response regulator [Planctomycetia bacterium]MCK6463393.1 response regulator [Phycisphaerae bacterium]MCL4717015.1 response regulator [Phycisphaerae bacterium]